MTMRKISNPDTFRSNIREKLAEIIPDKKYCKNLEIGVYNYSLKEANMRKVIIQEMPINPIFYGKMSVLLQELIELRKKHSLDYEKYLKEIESLAKQINPENRKNLYPPAIDTVTKQSLFDLLQDETKTLALESDISVSIEENWTGNIIKERKVRYAINEHIKDEETVDKIMDMLRYQDMY